MLTSIMVIASAVNLVRPSEAQVLGNFDSGRELTPARHAKGKQEFWRRMLLVSFLAWAFVCWRILTGLW